MQLDICTIWAFSATVLALLSWVWRFRPKKKTPAALPAKSVLEAAKFMVLAAERNSEPATSGEYKRHQVLSRLMKAYPEEKQRDLALAIELAVREKE